jgi:hypothetical protein
MQISTSARVKDRHELDGDLAFGECRNIEHTLSGLAEETLRLRKPHVMMEALKINMDIFIY